MSSGADWSRTCEGCAHIVNEPGPKDTLWARCAWRFSMPGTPPVRGDSKRKKEVI